MARTATSFIELGQIIEEEIQSDTIDFVKDLWKEIVLNPIHPYDTGTLQNSWKMIPYIGGGQGNAGDTFKLTKGTEAGQYPFRNDYPDFDKYRKKWRSWVLFNNQPYTWTVNDNEKEAYAHWIEIGYHKAIQKNS